MALPVTLGGMEMRTAVSHSPGSYVTSVVPPLKYGRCLGPGVQGGQADGGDQCYGWAGAGVHRSVPSYQQVFVCIQHLAIQVN